MGGYSDWLRQRPEALRRQCRRPRSRQRRAPTVVAAAPKRKLSYKDARELEQLPGRIEALETRLAEMAATMNDPAFYQRGSEGIATHNAAMAAAQAELDTAYARWAELDA